MELSLPLNYLCSITTTLHTTLAAYVVLHAVADDVVTEGIGVSVLTDIICEDIVCCSTTAGIYNFMCIPS